MIGLAVSIDYSLFIVSRYRTSCEQRDDRRRPPGARSARQVPR